MGRWHPSAKMAGNAGTIFIKCKTAECMPRLGKQIDELYHNSDFPTRTQTEEAFDKMFADMLGDLKSAIYGIGLAVVFALIFVAGNAMAMAMRERTSEVAVLKAIGFPRGWCFSWCCPKRCWSPVRRGYRCLREQGRSSISWISPLTRAGCYRFSTSRGTSPSLAWRVSLFVGLASGLFPASSRPTRP